MKTKIIIIIIALKALSSATAYAQDKPSAFYIKVYGGYTLFTPGSDRLAGNDAAIIDDIVPGTYKESKLGPGAGLNAGFGIAVPVGKLWLAGIDVNYLDGQKLTFNEQSGINGYTNVSDKYSVWSIIPNITYKVLPMPNYFIYTKLGIIIAPKTTSQYMYFDHDSFEQTDPNNNYSNVNDNVNNIKYGVNLGVQAAAGVQYKLSKCVSIFGELTGNFLTVKARSLDDNSTFTSVVKGQTDQILIDNNHETFVSAQSGLATRQTSTSTVGVTTTDDFTETGPRYPTHINSVVFNVGVVVGFK